MMPRAPAPRCGCRAQHAARGHQASSMSPVNRAGKSVDPHHDSRQRIIPIDDENAVALAKAWLAKFLAESGADATAPAPAAASAAATEPPLTIDDFCKIEGMSRATYYKLRRIGLGPQLTEIVIPAEPGINH